MIHVEDVKGADGSGVYVQSQFECRPWAAFVARRSPMQSDSYIRVVSSLKERSRVKAGFAGPQRWLGVDDRRLWFLAAAVAWLADGRVKDRAEPGRGGDAAGVLETTGRVAR